MTTITNNNQPTTTRCCLKQPSNCRVESETPHYWPSLATPYRPVRPAPCRTLSSQPSSRRRLTPTRPTTTDHFLAGPALGRLIARAQSFERSSVAVDPPSTVGTHSKLLSVVAWKLLVQWVVSSWVMM